MVRLEEYKDLSENKAIDTIALPAKVYIPLLQHLGKPCSPTVSPGERVLTGQRIAEAQAHAYAPIHASVSGTVSGIMDWPHPALGRCKTVAIDSDGKDERSPGLRNPAAPNEVAGFSPEALRQKIFEAGIVGMGGAGFPTHIKLNPAKQVADLIINASECEPFLTSDYRLMVERADEIMTGIEVMARCLGLENVHIAIEDNKPRAIENLKASAESISHKPRANRLRVSIVVLKAEYPQGGEKQLIKSIMRKEVPQGKLPFDIGVVVQNVATAFAVYEALYLQKPLYERVVTTTGTCLTAPKNILARVGTPIAELIASCGPLKEPPAKIIIGGPMMGIAQYTDVVPVIKTTTGIVLLNRRQARQQEELVCIRCGACVRACPAGLLPCMINLASLKEMWPQTKAYGALDCIECGCCNYVCPSNRVLVQSIKMAKMELTK